eukprot:2826016-Amphidinium_carterae.2
MRQSRGSLGTICSIPTPPLGGGLMILPPGRVCSLQDLTPINRLPSGRTAWAIRKTDGADLGEKSCDWSRWADRETDKLEGAIPKEPR